ncbi:MAG: SGNH/GDSL hydrolase family protein [Bryobacterales bacterium]|nr:SGNH/GDSL hydrolase family protein [Bryobacterales bacterium]
MRELILLGCFAATLPVFAQTRVTGAWTIEVEASSIAIPPLPPVTVTNELHPSLPDFDAKAAPWRRGARLTGVVAEECTVQGALDPGSLTVRTTPGAAALQRGVDYEADLAAGTVGRLPGGAIGAAQPVFLSYRYTQQRLDSIVRTATGKIEFRRGAPHAVTPAQPDLAAGETRLVNVLVSAREPALREDNVFPVLEAAYPEPARGAESMAASRLPKTLAKLQSGEPVKIMAWGDSVSTYRRYQTMFVDGLRRRFPSARIELVTEAWGGRSTGSYLKEPPGSEHNYQEKVLAQKPDLIVSEFVNDASLNEEQVEARYSQLLADFNRIGAEWIILSPHYVRPDWMGLTRQRDIDDDPRPYVKGLRRFATRHNVALADASLRYGRLWRQGIPYLTLMENNINHPNLFGHRIFADSLLALFP